jgi:hypothetical protein
MAQRRRAIAPETSGTCGRIAVCVPVSRTRDRRGVAAAGAGDVSVLGAHPPGTGRGDARGGRCDACLPKSAVEWPGACQVSARVAGCLILRRGIHRARLRERDEAVDALPGHACSRLKQIVRLCAGLHGRVLRHGGAGSRATTGSAAGVGRIVASWRTPPGRFGDRRWDGEGRSWCALPERLPAAGERVFGYRAGGRMDDSGTRTGDADAAATGRATVVVPRGCAHAG